MNTNFKISAIDNDYNHLFTLSQDELLTKGYIKIIADKETSFPCRVGLKYAKIGEEILLFPFEHHKTDSPYRSSGPIFVKKDAKKVGLAVNEIPEVLLNKFLSIRAYDKEGIMIYTSTIDSKKLNHEIGTAFDNDYVNYIHIHNSGPGCYSCKAERL
ncbi:MAG: DUF1203 domain-containing protein [Flavobacteriaceae bacterium]|nr:DUF1203 domain-containing protein [Flavobacteriaceae bacterium]